MPVSMRESGIGVFRGDDLVQVGRAGELLPLVLADKAAELFGGMRSPEIAFGLLHRNVDPTVRRRRAQRAVQAQGDEAGTLDEVPAGLVPGGTEDVVTIGGNLETVHQGHRATSRLVSCRGGPVLGGDARP